MRQIILDTETTGFNANDGDRLIEFAGLEMIDRRLTGQYLHLYVHPERDVPEDAVRVHGLTLAVLEEKNAPVFAKVGAEIADFIRDAELIIHNAPFDVGFLNMEFKRMGLPPVEQLAACITDTLKMAKERYPGQKNSLDALCTRLDVDRSRRVFHGALIDCELLAEVYLGMTRSQFSLTDAFDSPENETAATVAQATHSVSAKTRRLSVLPASADELARHEAYLDALDKACGGNCVWRQTRVDA